MKILEFMSEAVLSLPPTASLDEAMDCMDHARVRHVPVVASGRLVGIVSDRDLLQATGWLPRRTRELLDAPDGNLGGFMQAPVVTVSPMDSVVTAALRMVEWSIGCLPVLDDARLVGMLSERDVMAVYVKACAGASIGVDSDPHVDQLMATNFVCAAPCTSAEEALESCRAKKLRHLPLQLDGELVGMLSDRDLRRAIGCGQLEGTPVGELGAARLITMPASARLSQAAEVMLEESIGAIPITSGRRMLGMIGCVDVLKHCIGAFATVAARP